MTITYCKQCGGVTSMTYSVASGAYVESAEVFPVGPVIVMLCAGHPEPKHNGNLDDRNERRAYFMTYYQPPYTGGPVMKKDRSHQAICIEDLGIGVHICLLPAQALSLLSYLQQEKPTLERLIEEATRDDRKE